MSGLRVCVLLLSLVPAAAALGADAQGQFSVKSVGTATCKRFVEARGKADKEYALFAGYVGGYLSAYNQTTPGVFDVMPWQTMETLSGMLDNYCRRHAESNFAVAVTQLIKLLEADQLSRASGWVEAGNKQTKVKIYQETLRRAQAKLAALGHYGGKADGRFGADTRAALEKYQAAKGLPKSGLPDQLTLVNLLLVQDAPQ